MPQQISPNPESQHHRHLVAIAQSKGDQSEEAIATLIKTYRPLIARSCRAVPDFLREDAVSAGVEGFLHAIARYDPTVGASLGTYAMKYVRGSIVRMLKQEQKHDNVQPIDDLKESGIHLVHQTYDLSSEIVIRQWLKRQPERVRKLICLRFYAGFSLAEIARLQNVSRAAVSQQLKRILGQAEVALQGLVRIEG